MEQIIAALIAAVASIVVAIINFLALREQKEESDQKKMLSLREERETTHLLDGKHCPSCGADIGIMSIINADWPNRIKCPRCGVRLGYDIEYGSYILRLIAYFIFFAFGFFLAANGNLVVLVFIFIIILISEFERANYLRNNKILRIINRGKW